MHILRKRWRSRKTRTSSPGGTGRGSKKKIVLIVVVLFGFFSVQSFIFLEKNLRPPLMNIAKIRVKQKATEAINKAITDTVAGQTNFEQLVDWKTDNNGKITGFMLNYAEHMRIAADTVQVVQETLQMMQSMPDYVPVGQALNSAILASFGPDIPIRFVPAGAVQVDLSTRQKDAGINMLLVEVYIRISAEVRIIIPFNTEPETVATEIPISYLLVVGDVPMYYFDGKGNPVGGSQPLPPNISLPSIVPPGAPNVPGASSPNAP